MMGPMTQLPAAALGDSKLNPREVSINPMKTRHAVTTATACHGISKKKTSQCMSKTMIVARAQSTMTRTYVVTSKKS